MRSLGVRRSFFAILLALVGSTALAQQPAAIFNDQCSGCHTIGGGAGAGPDLKGVGERRERAWLLKFVHDPQSLLAARDPTALAAQKDFAGMDMPAFPDLSLAQREALLDYIAQQSGASSAAPPPPEVQVSTDPQAIAAGKRIFMGQQRLARGGGACISCHSARGIEGLGGGRLGPDISRAYERLGKAKGMTGWLAATPTPVMSVLYKTHPLTADEISALTSFFQDASQAGAANDAGRYKFLGIAAGFTVLGFLLIGGAGRNRLRSVRERLTGPPARAGVARAAVARAAVQKRGER